MRHFSIVLLCLSVLCAQAKGPVYKLGKVTTEELKITECPIDAEADAYIIFDKGKTQVELDLNREYLEVVFQREIKLKVLNIDAAEIGNWEIPLHKNSSDRERISDLRVVVYNLEGNKVVKNKMDGDYIHEVEVHKYKDAVKFAIPEIKAGSIIEIEYTIRSPFLRNLYPWNFQDVYPTLHSEYSTLIPYFYEYRPNIQGYVNIEQLPEERITRNFQFKTPSSTDLNNNGRFDVNNTSIQVMKNTYRAENVPAFQDEPFTSSHKNFISRVVFVLASSKFEGAYRRSYSRTWEDIDRSLLDASYFGKFVNNGKSASRILDGILDGTETDEEAFIKIYYSARKNLNWNQFFSYSASKSPFSIWEKGLGSSGDLNLLLVALMREAGLSAHPVITSTRGHGYVYTDYPSYDQFNHVVAMVELEGNRVFLDLTGINNPPGILPFHDLNGKARIISSTGKWINLRPSSAETDKYLFNLTVNEENNELECESRWEYDGISALNERNRFSASRENAEKIKLLSEKYPDIEIDSVNTDGGESLSDKLTLSMNMRSRSHLEEAGTRLIITPLLTEDLMDNPFKSEERIFPVDFGTPISEKYMITLTVPEGYMVSSSPEAIHLKLPDDKGKFIYQAIPVGNMVQINYSFKVNASLFSSAEYPYLKQFFAIAEDKVKEPIVLEKK